MEEFLESAHHNESTTRQSPRLQQLYTALKRSGGSALSDFWHDTSSLEAPLAEGLVALFGNTASRNETE